MTNESKKEPPSNEQLHSLRDRLYDRSYVPQQHQRTVLEQDQVTAPQTWGQPEQPTGESMRMTPDTHFTKTSMSKRHRFRAMAVLFGLFFFVIALGLSSVYLFMGGNTISGDNIAVSIEGPLSISGGEELSLQVSVTNQNSSPINSATLIMTYPSGTQAPDTNRELLRETVPLDQIASGETVNVPIRAILYGEEDEEKQILAEVEYQVQGSNGIFFKEAEPYIIKLNSSPVTVSISSLEKISSGQEVELAMTVRSNAPTTLHDLVVQAAYPFGFDYSSADPKPVSGQGTWIIDELKPNESKVITVKGQVVGSQKDERIVTASVGVANESDKYTLASVFSVTDFSYAFEQEFIDLGVVVNRSAEKTVVVDSGGVATAVITVSNTTEDTFYDVELSAELSGTAFSESQVEAQGGFYDSIKNAVLFDRFTNSKLEQIVPGGSVSLSFSITPDLSVQRTPEINLLIDAEAQRVQESNVPEALVGSAQRLIKFSSVVDLLSSTGHVSGPVPPVAEKLTQYQLSFRAEAGGNDLVDAEMTASVPNYVTWLDMSSGDGAVTFNATTRTLRWAIGDIDSEGAAMANVTLGFLPSISQVDTTPTLLSSQSFKATDRFTGSTLRDTAPALTTEMSSEAGYGRNSGRVVRTENETTAN